MHWPAAQRSLIIYLTLLGLAVAICGWQAMEHRRVQRRAEQELINRGRDITSTVGIVVRSLRRFGIAIPRERIGSALQDLVRPGDLESIAVLGATGEPIVTAGRPLDLAPDVLRERGVFWRENSLTLVNLLDLGSNVPDDGTGQPALVVVDDERLSRALRAPPPRRPTDGRDAAAAPAPPRDGTPGRPAFGRPPWMSETDYQALIQKQGVRSMVIALSTAEMHRAVRNDWMLRSLVSLLVVGVALLSGLAWRNLAKTADLQIRLVKAGEANLHLKEMNLAAAGLAHETRNPLNLIRGLAQMVAMDAGESAKLKQHASAIIEEADRVTVQLNEFINYSKPREAHPAPVALARVVADVARTLGPDTEEKQIRLRLPDSPVLVLADEPLLRQALFNLLLNAVQAVPPGGQIEVILTQTEGREVTLEVRDDGPGVPTGQREAIFKPYVTMRPKGVGLGLAIVQQIVSAHGWEIACGENQPHGAVFRLSHLKVAAPTA
jgi:signal transduction histidine kinase